MAQILQSRPPATGVLKWEVLESALGSAPEGAPGNRGALGGAPESARGDWGCSRECSMWGVHRKSTLGSTLGSTPNLPEHSREHPPRAPRFPGAPSGALPRALSRTSHFSTPVTGGRDFWLKFGLGGGLWLDGKVTSLRIHHIGHSGDLLAARRCVQTPCSAQLSHCVNHWQATKSPLSSVPGHGPLQILVLRRFFFFLEGT